MKNKVLSSLLKAKEGLKTNDLESISHELRLAFLEDWSDTPDNIETSDYLNFGIIKNKDTSKIKQGLILKSQNDLISNILWTAFGDSKVPKQVLEYYPELKKEEWNQVIRIAQIVLSSFECEIER